MADQPYQSLYRRFRPQRFSDLRGQPHVVAAMLGALRSGRISHAYLFSGPRGTGKTSTARILAKALNCLQPDEGEPCGVCESCEAIAAGRSLSVHELDAASHNGVEAMRDLIARAPIGSPGRWKVYIVDEVHMLSTAASNALLKTLEEPPRQVVFVLATTDAHKVLPTVRSRTQHFEFRLLDKEELVALVTEVDSAADLGLGEAELRAAVTRGAGSARDTLSALDQIVAAGGAPQDVFASVQLVEAIAGGDPSAALVAVDRAIAAGADPPRIAESVVGTLREGFLSLMAPSLAKGVEPRVADLARSMGAAVVVKALEGLGRSQVAMRDALDPRMVLELAVVRAAGELPSGTGQDWGASARLEARLARLEELAGITPAGVHPGTQDARDAPASRGGSGVGAARAALLDSGALQSQPSPARKPPAGATASPSVPEAAPAHAPAPAPRAAETPNAQGSAVPRPAPARSGAPVTQGEGDKELSAPPQDALREDPSFPSREQLVMAWGDAVLASLTPKARARFRAGRFLDASGNVATFALPSSSHRDFCEPFRSEVEKALNSHFGVRMSLRLAVDDGGASGPSSRSGRKDSEESGSAEEEVDIASTVSAPPGDGPPTDAEARIMAAFPGAQEMEQ